MWIVVIVLVLVIAILTALLCRATIVWSLIVTLLVVVVIATTCDEGCTAAHCHESEDSGFQDSFFHKSAFSLVNKISSLLISRYIDLNV